MKSFQIAMVLAVLGTGLATNVAFAQDWAANHPRRVEANSRLATQNARIHQGVASGRLSHGQAHQLNADDRAIRGEERADASLRGGHITHAQQRQINHQENADSHAISGEKH